MTTTRRFRLEMSFNWDRLSESGKYFLDHYCICYRGAKGHPPICSTFLQFICGDEIDIFIFNRGFTEVGRRVIPQKFKLCFKKATLDPDMVSPPWRDQSPCSKFPDGEVVFDLLPVNKSSWAFPNVTGQAWAPKPPKKRKGPKKRGVRPLVVDTVGSYLFLAVLEVEDPQSADPSRPCRLFSFDPEMVVGEGTGGGGGGLYRRGS